jgi:uncharacterized Tic20 family protein
MIEFDDDRLDVYGRRYQPTDEECRWAMLCHLSLMALPVFGPIMVLMMKKDESSYIADQAKEALNFQLAMYVGMLICVLTVICAILLPLFAGAAVILACMAALEVKKSGVYFRYPFIFRSVV